MNHTNKNQLPCDSDDDDIIAIQERKGQSLVAREVEESQGFKSPSQKPIPPRRHRRRPQEDQPPSFQSQTTNNFSQAMLPNSFIHPPHQSGANAFESLESLLENQALSLSLTQESVHEMHQDNPAMLDNSNDIEMDQLVAMQGEQQHVPPVPPPQQMQVEQEKDTGNTIFNDSNARLNSTSLTRGADAKVTSGGYENGGDQQRKEGVTVDETHFQATDQENSTTWMDTADTTQNISNFQYNFQDHDEPNDSLTKELKRQRKKESKKKRAKRQSQSFSSSMMDIGIQEPLQPTHSLQQRLQKERQSRRLDHHHNKRDRSVRSTSPHRLPPHPYKRERLGRSISPRPSRSKSPRRATASSSPKAPARMEKAKKSLVGFRPSHWGQRQGKPPRGRPLGQLDSSSKSSQQQRKQLAAACATSNMLRPRRPSPVPDSIGPNTPVASNTSFRPDFLATAGTSHTTTVSSQLDDSMQIDNYEDSMSTTAEVSTASMIADSSFLATARAKAKSSSRCEPMQSTATNNSNKVLSNLLQQVKSEMRIEATRLRSGEYPFPNKVTSRFDLYDPRNRATSYMDVTLVGETCYPWESNGRGSKGPNNQTILGYVHNHHRYQDRDKLASQHHHQTAEKGLVWICFSSETLQEHNLLKNNNSPRGYQLRIYNAVVVPTAAGNPTILSTNLCEAYPLDILGPLQPGLEELVSQLAGASSADKPG